MIEIMEKPARKDAIFSFLNPEQSEAVEIMEGPLLVLAGAGTGKTRVLTTRIANILLSGRAFPSQILAVTFTNKAAREMSERITKILSEQGIPLNGNLWLGTFHSIFLRILRRHAEIIGYKENFNILDTDDQLRLLKTLIEEHNIDEKRWPAKLLAAAIDRLKDQGLTPEKAASGQNMDFAGGKLIKLYESYQLRLRVLNAMDFGDILLNTIELFRKNPDVLSEYQRKFKYVLVDEYQDTNIAQYLLLRLLAQEHKNICCVGDDDQSIYSWRGAEVGNILKFEADFPGAKIIRLERNYRSTQAILATASRVIANNKGRLGKTLWTEDKGGSKVKVVSLWDDKAEASYIAAEIEAQQQLHKHQLKEMAILVRAGFQTRSFEECFLSMSIPYKVIGGLRFYERMEIRDAIAYLRVTVQPDDDLAFERIINTPKRGIGNSSIDQIRVVARDQNISLTKAIELMLEQNLFKPRVREPLAKLMEQFGRWRQMVMEEKPQREIAEAILKESGYIQMWKTENSIEAQGRLENISEFFNAIEEFENLSTFLEHVSLVSDTDNITDNNMVNIMTLHSAKGLEFDTVFLSGWEEGLFPHQKSLDEKGTAGLEEERRLAYVGITRARKNLYITFAASRRIFNQWQNSIPSRFVDELPHEHIEMINSGVNYRPPATGQKVFFPSKNQGQMPVFKEKNKETYIQAPNAPSFYSGTRIFHDKFGYGTVISSNSQQLTIRFDKAGVKTLIESFVKKV